MKARIGVDAVSSVNHSLATSSAKLLVSEVWAELLQGEKGTVGADKCYFSS